MMDFTDYILFVPMFFLAIYLWLESQDFGVVVMVAYQLVTVQYIINIDIFCTVKFDCISFACYDILNNNL